MSTPQANPQTSTLASQATDLMSSLTAFANQNPALVAAATKGLTALADRFTSTSTSSSPTSSTSSKPKKSKKSKSGVLSHHHVSPRHSPIHMHRSPPSHSPRRRIAHLRRYSPRHSPVHHHSSLRHSPSHHVYSGVEYISWAERNRRRKQARMEGYKSPSWGPLY